MNAWSNLCRICLQENAIIPLFGNDDSKNVSAKLFLCLHEKIEDIEGYPRYICEVCNNTINIIFDLINKYKESCKVLEKHFLSAIKNEIEDSDCDGFSEPEILLSKLKVEFEPHGYEDIDKDKNIITEKPKRVKNKVQRKYKPKNVNIKTNNIGSSVLEGVFTWTGEKWCHSSTVKDNQRPPKIIGRQPTLKISEVKKEKKEKKEKKSSHPIIDKLCDLCGQVFNNADKLRRHHNKMHKPKEHIPCTVKTCKRTFGSLHYLKQHVKRKHGMERKFQCSDCGRTYVYKTELANHLKSHNREKYPKKLYSCKLCDKTYKCQKSVDIHERSVHTGLRPSICNVCDAAFFHDEYLRQHMMLHTGETPFHCPVCDRGYNQRGNMKSHLRIHKISELTDEIMKKMKPNLLKLLKMN